MAWLVRDCQLPMPAYRKSNSASGRHLSDWTLFQVAVWSAEGVECAGVFNDDVKLMREPAFCRIQILLSGVQPFSGLGGEQRSKRYALMENLARPFRALTRPALT